MPVDRSQISTKKKRIEDIVKFIHDNYGDLYNTDKAAFSWEFYLNFYLRRQRVDILPRFVVSENSD